MMKNLRYIIAILLIGTSGCLAINAQKQLKSPLKYSKSQKAPMKKTGSPKSDSSSLNNRENRSYEEEERQRMANEPERMTQIAVETADDPQQSEDDKIFTAVEQQAQFPGGLSAMMKYLSSNVHYPESAQQNNIQGRVIVQFVIKKDGSIGEVKVIRGVDESLDAEAIRVVKAMPRWEPGKNNGLPVSYWFVLPISFKLQAQ